MQLKILITLIVTAMMAFSGLVVLADGTANPAESNPYAVPSGSSDTYNLTFVAEGLTNLFNGSDGWSVVLYNSTGGIPLYPTANTVSIMVASGTYTYSATDYFQGIYSQGASPPFTVDKNTTIYLQFETPHTIIFNETGLASNYRWGVNMAGSSTVFTPSSIVTGGSSVEFFAISGEYSYSWFENQARVNTTVGSSYLYIEQTNLTFSLPISLFSNVTFNENNLPSGTTWFIRQATGPDFNGSYMQTTANDISMSAMNGINTFIAGYVLNGFDINLTYITVDVGSENAISVDFPTLFNVSINAVNLPGATLYNSWGINASFFYGPFNDYFNETGIGNLPLSALLPETSVSEVPFIELNGNAGGTSPLYYVQFQKSYYQVSGSGQVQNINLGNLYNIKLSFPGMPSGDYLSIYSRTGNIQSFASLQAGSSVTLLAPNGTDYFTYGIGSTSAEASSMYVQFNFTVSGSGKVVLYYVYNTTFASDYRQSGYQLSIFSPANPYFNYFAVSAAAGQNVSAYLLNGTYSYEMHSGYAGLSNSPTVETTGEFSVSGISGTVTVQVPETYYNTTFVTSGLPEGACYLFTFSLISKSVNIEQTLYGISGMNDYVYLPQGKFYISGIYGSFSDANYYANNTYFSVTKANTVYLNFSTNAYLKFFEQGLPAGALWSINFNGISYSSTGTTISVSGNASLDLPFQIYPTSDYYPDPASGSINPANQYNPYNNDSINYEIPVQFTPGTLSGDAAAPILTFNATDLNTSSGMQLNLSGPAGQSAVITIASDSANGLTYILYTTDSNQISYIAVVNSSTYDLVARISIELVAEPIFSVLDQANGILYSIFDLNSYGDHYYILSLNTGNNHMKLTPVNISGLTSLAVDPANGALYAAGYSAIYQLNPSTLAIISEILVNGSYATSHSGTGLNLFYSTETGFIYATGYIPNGIIAVNPMVDSIAGNYSFNLQMNTGDVCVGGSSIDQKDGVIYFTVQEYNATTGSYPSYIIAFNLSSGKFVIGPSIGQGWAESIAYNPQNGYLYIPVQMKYDYSSILSPLQLGQLDIYDPSNGLLINYTELSQNPSWISVNPANGNVLIGNGFIGSVTIMGTNSYGIINGSVNTPTASVTIDGIAVPVINGHFAASVPHGTYYVSAFAKGFLPVDKSVRVGTLATSTVALGLNATAVTYNIIGRISPAGASVLFNGIAASVNGSGHYHIYVVPGKYTVSAYLNGYFPFSEKVDIESNMSVNLTLAPQPLPSSEMKQDNFSVMGFNVNISSLSSNSNSTFSVRFNSSANGILVVEVPLASLNNANLTTILDSRVYINNLGYNNFSIVISPNYTVILKVSGLNKDPTLLWMYGPEAVPPKAPAGSSLILYYYIAGALIAAIIIAGAVVTVMKRRSMKK